MSAEQQYLDLYAAERETLEAHSPAPLNALREAAADDFRRLGFPTQRVERYKYTNVAEAFAPDYGLNLRRLAIPVNPADVFRCDVPRLSTTVQFVVNDQVAPAQSPYISTFAARPDIVAQYLGRLARSSKDAINALNTMLAEDGLLIYIPRGVRVEKPIQLVDILRADVPLMVNRRVLIVLEPEAELRLLVCDHAIDAHPFLTTQVTEAFVGENAHLELYDLEETHDQNHRFTNTYIDLARSARLTFDTVTLSAGLSRNRADVTLSGAGAEVDMYGLVIADARQHVDHNTLIDHRAPSCRSNELYRYVLDDHATGAFAGRVLVREGAQKTVSQETNANLVATSTARMYTQPMLEIYADDVRCAHGSTVGQLSDDALFYMRQRGIPEAEARLLLKYAFVGQVIDAISLPALADRLHYLCEKRLRGELAKCGGCQICNEQAH